MPRRTLLFALLCAMLVAGCAVAFSWTVGPHENLVTAIDDLVGGDEVVDVDRNLSPWCWTGSCPSVTATSLLDGDVWSTEQEVNQALRARGYTLTRDDRWLVATNAAHTIQVRFLAETGGRTLIEWSAVGN